MGRTVCRKALSSTAGQKGVWSGEHMGTGWRQLWLEWQQGFRTESWGVLHLSSQEAEEIEEAEKLGPEVNFHNLILWNKIGQEETELRPPYSAQATITECHRLGGFNNRRLLLTVLEAGMSKINVPADSFPAEGLILACRWPPSCCVCPWQREEALGSSPCSQVQVPSWGLNSGHRH